jgi:hypothetical protein
MEPEGSLPHSQVSATCPYLEPARSSPYHHIPLPEVPSYYLPDMRLNQLSVSSTHNLQVKTATNGREFQDGIHLISTE